MIPEEYQQQHKQRLNYMPWLYFSLKPKHQAWARGWQEAIQQRLQQLETVVIGRNCFIAESARLFAEPGRTIVIGDGSFIAADTFIHGPVTIGKQVSINSGCRLDGGRAGIQIGDQARIAAGCAVYAFNHGMATTAPIAEQPVSSDGIRIGADVWIGAHCGITDGVIIGDHAVVGMNSTVTRKVEPWAIVAGSPARTIGDRRDK